MYIECSLRGLMTAFFRQKAKFFLAFGLVLLLGVLYLATIKPVYEAKGSFLVKFGQGAVPDLSRSSGQGAGDFSESARDEIIQSNAKILQSSGLLDEVIKEIGVENLYPGISGSDSEVAEQAAIEQAARSLKVFTDAKSNIIEIHATNENPEMAKQFVEHLMDKFIVRQSEVYRTPQTNFLQQQIAEAKQQLQEAQKQFQDFKQEVGISALDEEMAQLLQEKRDISGLAFHAVTEAQANLAKLESEAAEAATTYIATSPALKRMRNNVEVARAQVLERQNDLNAIGTGESPLAQKMTGIDERIAHLEANRSRYEELEQHVMMSEDNYKYYQQRGEEARVNDMLNQQNITRMSVIDSPVLPVQPVPVNKKLLLIAFLMTAGLFGLGVALAFEILDDSIAYPEQITHGTGLPVFASIASTLPAGKIAALLDSIAHNLSSGHKAPVIHLVSAGSGEGADMIALEIASLNAVQNRKKTLLIGPKQFGGRTVPPHAGQGGDPAASFMAVEGTSLFLTAFGQSGALDAPALQAAMDRLRQAFDLIVIQSEAALANPLAIALARLADGSIVVVEAERTRVPVIRELKRAIEASGGRIIGAVLNKRKFYIPRFLYPLFFKA